jgi:hypothetical protein
MDLIPATQTERNVAKARRLAVAARHRFVIMTVQGRKQTFSERVLHG